MKVNPDSLVVLHKEDFEDLYDFYKTIGGCFGRGKVIVETYDLNRFLRYAWDEGEQFIKDEISGKKGVYVTEFLTKEIELP